MTFGFTTLVDALSWIAVLTLGLKAVATVTLLVAGKEKRDRPGWGAALWWTTKITPIIAVPCVVAIAVLNGDREQLWLFLALAAFVVVAVPVKVRQRRARIATRASTKKGAGTAVPTPSSSR